MGLGERGRFEQKVRRLTGHSAPMPDFSGFHPAFRDHSSIEDTPEGDVRRAFYLSYDDTTCEYLTGERDRRKAQRRRRRGVRDVRHALPAGIPGARSRAAFQPRDPVLHPRSGHPRDPWLQARLRVPGVHRESDRNGQSGDCVAHQRTPATGPRTGRASVRPGLSTVSEMPAGNGILERRARPRYGRSMPSPT